MGKSSSQNLEMRIAVMGLGYVGITSAALFAQSGHYVVGTDIKQGKVDAINQGRVGELYEEGLSSIVHTQRSRRRLRATMDIQDAITDSDIGYVCVGTPSKKNGEMEFKYLQRVCKDIGLCLKDKKTRYTVVIRSTMFPGSLNKIKKILEDASGKKEGELLKFDGFDLVTNPEFLREGTAVKDFYNPPYVVVGADPPDKAAKVLACYNKVEAKRFIVHPDVAQMIKYANNSWHATKITFTNEISAICKAKGIDPGKVMGLFCEDKQLNISPYYMKPGFAYGGSCLSKDTDALIREADRLKVQTPLLNSVPKSNNAEITRGIKLIDSQKKKKLGFLGLSFKPGTDDRRSNPILKVIEHFERRGYDIKTWDPNEDENDGTKMTDCMDQEIVIVSSRDEQLLNMAKGMAKGNVINLQE